MMNFDWEKWERQMRRWEIVGYVISALWVVVAIVYLGLALGWWSR